MASIIYLIWTRYIGTPFRNALEQYPELLNIKLKSAKKRGQIFYIGITLSIVLLAIIRPFEKC